MAPPGRRKAVGPGPRAGFQRPRQLKRKREAEDLDVLNKRVAELDPKSSTPPENFVDVPLSQATQDGLSASHFKTLTTIQSRTIPLALRGIDILGAAKTGSGKTLAFLIPVLENLYRKRWTEYDGGWCPHPLSDSRACNPNLRSPPQNRPQPHLLSRPGHWRQKSTRRKGAPEPNEHSRSHAWPHATTHGSDR